jgi:hypothetical protein
MSEFDHKEEVNAIERSLIRMSKFAMGEVKRDPHNDLKLSFQALANLVERVTDNKIKLTLKRQGSEYYDLFLDCSEAQGEMREAQMQNIQGGVAEGIQIIQNAGDPNISDADRAVQESLAQDGHPPQGHGGMPPPGLLKVMGEQIANMFIGGKPEPTFIPVAMLCVRKNAYPVEVYRVPDQSGHCFTHTTTLFDWYDLLGWVSMIVKHPASAVVLYCKQKRKEGNS